MAGAVDGWIYRLLDRQVAGSVDGWNGRSMDP